MSAGEPDLFDAWVTLPEQRTEALSLIVYAKRMAGVIDKRVQDRIIPDENWSSRNQNKLLFKGKYPRLYYWFAARWLVKEVNVDRMWRMEKRPYLKIAIESAKLAVARLGIAAVDAASFYRAHA